MRDCPVKYVLLLLLLHTVQADEHNHEYEHGDEVVLWMNTVGPYRNRQETYPYYSLPYCHGRKQDISHYHETLGEALQGVELQLAGVDIDFGVDVQRSEYCAIVLDEDSVQQFVYAVQNEYWYQMYIDDLPIWGVVGERGKQQAEQYFIWTHRRLDIGINGKQIVDVNLTSSNRVQLVNNKKVSFTYEVHFKQSGIEFINRFDKYLDANFFQHSIHWFSIVNSFVMVVFLIGLVLVILLRTLRRDIDRYTSADDGDTERDFGDDYGWKQVHGDVFRSPASPLLFSTLIGCGAHLIGTILCLLLLAMGVEMYSERGTMLSAAIFIYAASAPLGGCAGAAIYTRCGQSAWIKQAIIQALLMPCMISSVAMCINIVAIGYGLTRSLPLLHSLAVVAIVLFVVLPLSVLGTIAGRHLCGRSALPCRVNAVPRPLPVNRWLMRPLTVCLLAGVLPFGSIFVEMYFVFTSFWAYKIYYVFGFSFLAFVMMLCVTACVSIVAAYFLLNAEDYRWQWAAFFASASTSLYLYAYSVYYFFFKTRMYGLYQTVFYFGQMALFCSGVALICGCAGFYAASRFVRRIYSNIKID